MTADERKQMKDFEVSAHQVLALCQRLKDERESLRQSLQKTQNELGELNLQLEQTRQNYTNLKTARMLELSDSDVRNARQRITHLVREVNKCIRMISTDF